MNGKQTHITNKSATECTNRQASERERKSKLSFVCLSGRLVAGCTYIYRTHININVCVARNQLKSTFYFYDCTFLRTRAKFILFCVCVSFGICTNKYMRTTTTTKIYGKREAHEYIDTHTFDCKETTHIYDYIRCMRFNIIYLNSGDGVRERVSEIETPTVLLENSLPSIQIIIPSPICCCVHLIRMSHLACFFFLSYFHC